MKLSNPYVTPHAISRAASRFGVGRSYAINWAKQKAKTSTFISEIVDNDGKPGRLFVSNGVGLIADITQDVIVTIIDPRTYGHASVNRKLHRLAAKELANAERDEAKELRKLTKLQAELEIEIGELRLRLVRARSIAKRIAIQARINALKMRVDELPSEEHAVKRDRVRKVTALARVM